MPISHGFSQKKVEEDSSEMEDSCSEDLNSDNSEYDPTYDDDDDADDDELDKAQSKLSELSIKRNPNSRDHTKLEVDDGEVSDMEEISVPMLSKEDMKNFQQVQKLIDAGQVEKLKVEQCKVYLRKHGLRLTGKKDILIQRIKEHIKVLNGGGEKKYPPSSFVLNCKGDACMGDIVMFQQTVYEGYNIASRSACGPPCGERIVAGRIVKESYGAAKQQHTFTVEVLWSKGEKPLPPLHPLLIKGRNLYKLNTMRQRWEDEAERQRVLNEKHRRGSIARSNREARIQEKEAKKMIKGKRGFPKKCQSSHQQKNMKHEPEHIAQQQQIVREPNPKFRAEFKENFYHQPPPSHKSDIPAYTTRSSYPLCIGHPTNQPGKPAGSSHGSHCGYLENCFNGNAMSSDKFLQTQRDPRGQLFGEYKENLFPKSYSSGYRNMATYGQGNLTLSDRPQPLIDSNWGISYERNHQRPSNPQQNLCRY